MSTKGISGGLNLLKLKGSRKITDNNEKGIFIPFRDNTILDYDENRVFLNIAGLPLVNDPYKNDFMIVRSRTKAETESNTQTEILGNVKYWDVAKYSNNSQGQQDQGNPLVNSGKPNPRPSNATNENDDPF